MQDNPGTPPPSTQENDLPSLTFESLTFSDGTTISLGSTDVVVMVGPNNSGKSAALRDVKNLIRPIFHGTVIKSATRRRIGEAHDLIEYLEKHGFSKEDGSNKSYAGPGFAFPGDPGWIHNVWNDDDNQSLCDFFCKGLTTETRIQDSNPAEAISSYDSPNHPIQAIYWDHSLERKISGHFRRAFGQDLILYRMGGRSWPLCVGSRQELGRQEDSLDPAYQERLRTSTQPLECQGDGMRSFASVIVHLLASVFPSVMIIDEPEAFLHPPQSRILGEILATERPSRVQLFIATHSSDVLQGLLNVAPKRLRLLRVERSGGANPVKELSRRKAIEISSDSLMRSSTVLSGVFHERVFIVESDADSMFYSAILDLPSVHGSQQPDVHFVHANGMHRMANLVEALIELNVRTDLIVDIDVFQEVELLARIYRALGGEWSLVEEKARFIKEQVELTRKIPIVVEIKNSINSVFDKYQDGDVFSRFIKRDIQRIFRASLSPWEALKRGGSAAVPAGKAAGTYTELTKLFAKMGLWIVPVGELERFCVSIPGHGPKWVQGVIEQRKLADDPELEGAREFVKKIWSAPSR